MCRAGGSVPHGKKCMRDIQQAGTGENRREVVMSEFIQNRKDRKNAVKEIIRSIENGTDVQNAKRRFNKIIRTISPEEIAEIEQELISEGMDPEEVRNLCELHVEVFRKAVSGAGTSKTLPGHPVASYKAENKETKKRIRTLRKATRRLKRGKDDGSFSRALSDLRQIEIHYARKENQLFPYLEDVGFTGPSKVMWGKHDEIRSLFKETQELYASGDFGKAKRAVGDLTRKIKQMIFMEHKILFPTALRKLTDPIWAEIRRGESEIGYAWITPGNLWDPSVIPAPAEQSAQSAQAGPDADAEAGKSAVAEDSPEISLDVGRLTGKQLNLMLKSLPVDLTFVDENDRVRYYSQTPERVFPRSPGIIGRSVQNCHPPKSVHVVEKIVDAFKKKEKDVAEFWLELDGKFIHIRYYPLFDEEGSYRGVIEVSQDVTGIRALEGSRTLLDW